MPQVAVPAEGAARAVGSPSGHPLATSVATVDGAVTSLSFRMLDIPGFPSSMDSWIECEHALSDPAFFPWWRAAVAQRPYEVIGLLARAIGQREADRDTIPAVRGRW